MTGLIELGARRLLLELDMVRLIRRGMRCNGVDTLIHLY